MMAQSMVELQGEHEQLRVVASRQGADYQETERELKRLQERQREIMGQLGQAQVAKEHLEQSLRVAQEEVQRFNERYGGEFQGWRKERAEMELGMRELAGEKERVKAESQG